MPQISGRITDINGNGVARLVRAYRRDTGALMGETTSNRFTGDYTITTAYAGEHTVIMLDDVVGTLENDQCCRVIPV